MDLIIKLQPHLRMSINRYLIVPMCLLLSLCTCDCPGESINRYLVVQVSVNDFVAVKPDDPSLPLYVGQVMYFYQQESNRSKEQLMAHIMWFK